ncbi:arylsulfatase [Bacteroidota bacterium]
MKYYNLLPFMAVFAACNYGSEPENQWTPNIIYILADDMGFGDIQCQNNESKYPTPNIDQLAEQGCRFTDVHTNSSVSSPTRYGILTGRYAWRSRLKKGVLGGYSTPLIEKDRTTVASFLKDNGYNTAAIGKWHLGLNWANEQGNPVFPSDTIIGLREWQLGYKVDFSKAVLEGPKDIGFDYSFIIPCSPDASPYVYVENNKATQLPTKITEAEGFGRKGLVVPGLKAEDILIDFTEKAVEFINNQTNNKDPFFLYMPLSAPHKPVAPAQPFKGLTKDIYGDFLCEVDWVVGQIMNALEKTGKEKNTILIFTADNGASPNAAVSAVKNGHKPNRPYRGGKTLLWEGGHRVPFIVRWPGKVRSNSSNDDLYCTTDMLATVADLLNKDLPENAGQDSRSMLASILGRDMGDENRGAVIHHSVNGDFAIRKGSWKYITINHGGGWGNGRDFGMPILPIQKEMEGQLYNIEDDVYERNNLYQKNPEIVGELKDLLNKIKK